ncbi:hypothetical protein GCM10009557_51400 [Virgisporangium ochraceum]|nr:hypothetical protein [Virgisporangium ochraceum]
MMLPVGHYTGSEHPPGHRTIRVGRTRVSFPDDEPFLVWAAAHRPPGDLAAPWGRREVAAASEVTDPEPLIDGLLRDGLLVELTDPEAFARAYKAVPILIALGNTPADPDRFGIGLFGLDPVITVPPRVFEVWQWGTVGTSLWAVSEAFAIATTRATGEPVSPEDVLGGFLHALPALVGSNALYLDVVEA